MMPELMSGCARNSTFSAKLSKLSLVSIVPPAPDMSALIVPSTTFQTFASSGVTFHLSSVLPSKSSIQPSFCSWAVSMLAWPDARLPFCAHTDAPSHTVAAAAANIAGPRRAFVPSVFVSSWFSSDLLSADNEPPSMLRLLTRRRARDGSLKISLCGTHYHTGCGGEGPPIQLATCYLAVG